MAYSKLSDSFMLKSVSAGASTITTRNMDMFGIGNGSYSGGSNARVWIDDGVTGQWINSNSNTIEFRGGAKITLNHTTDPVVNDNDYLTITFKRDATEALDKIKSFIEGYNSLIQKLEDMLKETKTSAERAYGPLTEEEKSLMTEKQIEDWEAIAKKGVLRSDAGIQSMLSNLRNALYATVKDAGVSPADIGIRTGAGMGGQIILDERGEEALRAALERDPEKVMKAFMGGEKATAYEERGLLWRIDDILQGYEKNSQSATLSNLANSIRRENEQIEKLTKKMWQEEEKLYMKFAAMETAMAKLQDQSDWFMSMLNNTNK
jgi:flagellar capping protein FliD